MVKTVSEYQNAVKFHAENPQQFWADIANRYQWFNPIKQSFNGRFEDASISWYEGGKTNMCFNAIDVHLPSKANHPAIIWEPNDPQLSHKIYTFQQLHLEVCKMAALLKSLNVGPGDRVGIYMPMIPEAQITMLACARIGAVHTVIFGGFSAQALTERLNDCGCEILVTATHSNRGDKTIPLGKIAHESVTQCLTVKNVLCLKLYNEDLPQGWISMNEALMHIAPDDSYYHADSSHPLFILYTSGSTGKPKGLLHTTGGYMVYAGYTFRQVFQATEHDRFWCTADVGWITGHTYSTYGPLLNGISTLLFEGIPTWPKADRNWEIIEKHQVTHFYTAPTALRSLMALDINLPDHFEMRSLKWLGSVGEPINEEAWDWLYQKVGKSRCWLTDTWWQTETGGIMIAPLAGITELEPCFAATPLPGIEACLLDETGQVTEVEGKLVIKSPWPGMAQSIWGDHERYKNQYFKENPGFYTTGDGAKKDEKGRIRILGRMDDVVNVSGHRIGTGEVEDALNEHPLIIESAIIGVPHAIKGSVLMAFIICPNQIPEFGDIKSLISQKIGSFAVPEFVIPVNGLPKTRSGKIMRRLLRNLTEKDQKTLGDTSTLLDTDILSHIKAQIIQYYPS